MSTHKVVFGDCRAMPELADQAVHLVVTSIPYWSLKDYSHEDQIGLGQSYEEYLTSMREVLSECFRSLHDGCRMIINTGDQYCSTQEHGYYHVKPISADVIRISQELGFVYMGDIIWRKTPNGKASGGAVLGGSLYYPRDGALNIAYEHILVFRKLGEKPAVSAEAKELSKLTKEERTKWFYAFWNDITPERQTGHVAMFPVELPLRIIKMFSFHGETVLDPFMGSGTTAKAAMMTGRNSIGYEINDKLEDMIRLKVVGDMPELWDDVLEFDRRPA